MSTTPHWTGKISYQHSCSPTTPTITQQWRRRHLNFSLVPKHEFNLFEIQKSICSTMACQHWLTDINCFRKSDSLLKTLPAQIKNKLNHILTRVPNLICKTLTTSYGMKIWQLWAKIPNWHLSEITEIYDSNACILLSNSKSKVLNVMQLKFFSCLQTFPVIILQLPVILISTVNLKLRAQWPELGENYSIILTLPNWLSTC